MTIGQLAEQTGVPASTIRYWERIGVLSRPARVSRQRRYSPDAVPYLAVLGLARACGFRLPEMRQLLHGFPSDVAASSRWQALARRKRVELDAEISRLLAMRRLVDRVLECQCASIVECGRRIGDRYSKKSPVPRFPGSGLEPKEEATHQS